ncbi:MAG: DNA replication/repair protein RecF [Hyphomicrobiaceae bacterium]
MAMTWVRALTVTNFRNYASLRLEAAKRPMVLIGANGAGKTNLLEAVSLLAPGQGMRRANFADLARAGADGDWSVAAEIDCQGICYDVGTGVVARGAGSERSGRIVRINGEQRTGSGALADIVEMVWLTPQSDGLFSGPASDRRRFLDRLILCFDPGYRRRVTQFDRAMRQRNRLLDRNGWDQAQFQGLENLMAETGVAIAAARIEAVTALQGEMNRRRNRRPDACFPWAHIELDGWLEHELAHEAAVDVEDHYRHVLGRERDRDRAAGRTLSGPHRSDLIVHHGPNGTPAKLSSTGEQKALLVSLILAHAELSAARKDGAAPILLLDEVTAHLDSDRREELAADLIRIGAQCWLTGTDRSAFAALEQKAAFYRVEAGALTRL